MSGGPRGQSGSVPASGLHSWVRALWLLQLLAPLVLLWYVWLRHRHGFALDSAWTLVAAASALWLFVGSGLLVIASGRRWMEVRARELLLAFGSVGLLAVLADAALSLTGAVPTFHDLYSHYSLHYQSAAFSLGRLEPNQVLAVPGGPRIEINSRGYRGPEIAVPKPAGVYRILFLGGSQVFDQYGDNWPVRVGEQLSISDQPVDVINAGTPSHRTVDSVGKLLTEIWTWEPDAVVLCQAWNDIKYFTRLTPETTYADLYRPLPEDWRKEPSWFDQVLGVSSFYRLGRTRVYRITHGSEGEARRRLEGAPYRDDRASAVDPGVARAVTPRIDSGVGGDDDANGAIEANLVEGSVISESAVKQYELGLEMICELAAAVGARPVLCTQPRLPTSDSRAQDREKTSYDYVGLDHDEIVRAFAICDLLVERVAERHDAVLLDLNARLSGRSELFADHIHFNQAGSTEAARVVAEELRALLLETPSPTGLRAGGKTP